MPFIERPFRLTARVEGVDIYWDDILGKPNKFPPEAHASSHGTNGSDPVTIDWNTQIANRPSAFPPEAHASTHAANGSDPVTVDWYTQIANRPSAFPPEAHVHSAADIASGRFGLSRLPDGPSGKVLVAQGIGNDPIWGDVPGAGPHAQTHAWNGSDPISPASILALDCEYTSRTIYVDSQYGSDTAGDGSSSAPYKTVSRALSTVRQVIADGVTITIRLVGRGPDYPYTIPTFGRVCIGSGTVAVRGELAILESGTVTGGSPLMITDDTKNWAPNCWSGKLVGLIRGTTTYWRLIESNSGTSLNVIGRLDITPQSGDSYIIYDWATFLANSTVRVTQGNASFAWLANTALSGSQAFRFQDPVNITLEGIWVRAAGNASSALILLGSPTITCRYCLFDGNGWTDRAISGHNAASLNMSMFWCWSKGWAGSSNVWLGGPGTYAAIREGTSLEGSSTVVLVNRGAIVNFYSGVVNGERDKVTIRNGATYGLRVSSGAGAIYTSTAYVNYSGNGTDRSADSTAWYLDTE